MNLPLAKNMLFNLDKFDDYKIRMQAHMSALHDKMWDVVIDGFIQTLKVNTGFFARSQCWIVYSKAKDGMDVWW